MTDTEKIEQLSGIIDLLTAANIVLALVIVGLVTHIVVSRSIRNTYRKAEQ